MQITKLIKKISKQKARFLWLVASNRLKKMRAGFTLIELSVVLVIIGLLVGGTMVGRDLIAAAETRGQISQVEKFTAATLAFRLKYDCLPGDCLNAVSIGLGSASNPGKNGNGDGKIAIANGTQCFNGGAGVSFNTAYESLNFWYHLSQAGLIEGTYSGYTGQGDFSALNVPQTTMPAAKIYGNIILPTQFRCAAYGSAGFRMTDGNGFWMFGPPPVSTGGSGAYPVAAIPVATAYKIDEKIDDGFPASGKIGVVETPSVTYPSVIGNTNAGYVSCENGSGVWNSYNISSSTLNCQLAFTNQF